MNGMAFFFFQKQVVLFFDGLSFCAGFAGAALAACFLGRRAGSFFFHHAGSRSSRLAWRDVDEFAGRLVKFHINQTDGAVRVVFFPNIKSGSVRVEAGFDGWVSFGSSRHGSGSARLAGAAFFVGRSAFLAAALGSHRTERESAKEGGEHQKFLHNSLKMRLLFENIDSYFESREGIGHKNSRPFQKKRPF